MKTSLLGGAAGVVPAGLRERVLDRLRDAPPALEPAREGSPAPGLKVLALRPPAHGPITTAAAALLMLAAVVGYQSYCVNRQCRMVMAAEQEHERIVAGAREVWMTGEDPDRLTRRVNEHLKFSGLPDLKDCRLRPKECGPVELRGAKGVYINLVDCRCQGGMGDQTVTLMIVDLDRMPAPNAPEIDGLRLASYADHSVCAWKQGNLVYFLVGKLPLHEVRQVAELVRR